MKYVFTKHPVSGEKIAAYPTGKRDGDQAEFRVITAQSDLDLLWLRRSDILKE